MRDKKFLLLTVFFLILRLYPIWLNNFPFNYDNAKDSLVIMQMWVFHKPALLGAVTSLEGLWQGPFWYYLFLPLNIIMQFHPIASVLSVVLLGVFTLWHFWKYFGRLEAFLYTVSASIITTHQTAWSPYLTSFSVAWILVIFEILKKNKDTKYFVLLALCLSIMFHAEIAFGVVFLLLLFFVYLINYISFKGPTPKAVYNVPSRKQVVIMASAFFSTFIPQGIFELRHNFLQTRSVLYFIQNFESQASMIGQNEKGLARIYEVVTYFAQNALESILPYNFQLPTAIGIFTVLAFFAFLIIQKDKQIKEFSRLIFLPIILGSIALYLFLPIKAFYLVGFTPIWILAFSKLLRVNGVLKKPVVVIFSVFAILNLFYLRSNYSKLSLESKILFASKLEAVNTAYDLANGRPFNSYHYVAELYDYTYQHIYQYTTITKNRELPVDYAYLPGKPEYMQTQKLISSNKTSDITILIVESDDRQELFDRWWSEVTLGREVVEYRRINNSISVYLLQSEVFANDNEKTKTI